ncbi:MAG: isoleucine--tRNA ligase [Cenarchaeum symbiont of Oopsacas minuta]|nr:isoleucine--tRNA ligase [Cenarchaeum symbiont of Oopsacas minuta]
MTLDKFDLEEIEMQARKRLDGSELRTRLKTSRAGGPKMRFVEGPPTMNGTPHAGHMRGRVIKDLWFRYSTLCGADVKFVAGWDTQGLPVELQAEKELKITGGKKGIESFGIESLVKECKRLVQDYNKKWTSVDKQIGISFDYDSAYWTMYDEYIEREWKVLQRANERGILELDYTVIAYCPGCQTSLSHAEVNQRYEEVSDPSMYYKVRFKDNDAYAIVWTTMPFTMVTDAMIGFNPKGVYKFVKVGNETWIVGEEMLEDVMRAAKIDEYNEIKTEKGSFFEGIKYEHPLLDAIPELGKFVTEKGYHIAVAEEFVDTASGSGIVHLSPANGEEDIHIAEKRGIPVFCPIDEEVKFTKDAGEYAGLFVRDADKIIVEDLRSRGALVALHKKRHKYPLCWRSSHRIVWLARRGWFYKLEKLEELAVDAAKNVEYFYDQPKNRFLAIVGEKHPWCISRERYWGCPIPAWNCTDCGNTDWFYSREQIIQAASHLPDGKNFELHRPWIDRVRIKCSKCGSVNTNREPYVLDTWHNSGAAPFASANDLEYKESIPVPFLTEGIDQTRGWAYTLLIENVILSGKAQAPFASFLFQGHVLDEKGGKMSKSLGNVIDAAEMIKENSADLLRLYFTLKSSPIEPLSFSAKEMHTRSYQILSTLYHMHLYFEQNSTYDGYDPLKHTVSWAKENNLLQSPDVWILSKLQGLSKQISEHYSTCRFHEAARKIDEFVIGMLSQVYVPITRQEIWDESDSNKDRRLAIYATLGEILYSLNIMLHPICPFITDYLYGQVFGKKDNILLQLWPKVRDELVDKKTEDAFDILRLAISVGGAARMNGNLKRRWPLDDAIVYLPKGQKEQIEGHLELLRSLLNVEKVSVLEYIGDAGLEQLVGLQKVRAPILATAELNHKKIGPRAREFMPEMIDVFNSTDKQAMAEEISKNSRYVFLLGDNSHEVVITSDDVEFGFESKDDWCISKREGVIVSLSSNRSKEMMVRGLVKDLARRIQSLRKERGFSPTDVLDLVSITGLDDEQVHAISTKKKELGFLVRVRQIDFNDIDAQYKDEDIDGQKIRLAIQ